MKKTVSRKRVATFVVLGLVGLGQFGTAAQPVSGAPAATWRVKPPRMSSDLDALAHPNLVAVSSTSSFELANVQSGPGTVITRRDGTVLVDIRVSSTGSEILRRLGEVGARIIHVSHDVRIVTAEILPANLEKLAALDPVVLSVTSVLEPEFNATCPTGATVSEGDAQLLASLGRSHYGVDGTGVVVGILSDSHNHLGGAPTDVTNGELPGATNPCGYPSPVVVQGEEAATGIDEGRAMGQIVHDLAPGAQIKFTSAALGEQATADGIRALAAAGAKVIVDDVSYFAEPMYQDGVIGQVVEDVSAAGVTYFSSAGNRNQILNGKNASSYETLAYRPTACPAVIIAAAGIYPPLDCHDFDPGAGADPTFGQGINAVSGRSELYVLGWNEPRFGIATDLDFWVLDAAGNVFDFSDEISTRSQRAFEINEISGVGQLSLVVSRYSGSGTPRFKFISSGNSLTSTEYPMALGTDVIGPSIYGHNASRSGVSVAATPYSNANTVETFSSRGPATYCWGGVVGSTPAAPLSPCQNATIDMDATDGTVTSFFGSSTGGVLRFFGTSASAPHAAAVAALIREKAPCFTAAQTLTAMNATARSIAGFDANARGSGLVNADAALAASFCGPPKVGPNVTKTLHVLGSGGVPVSGVSAVSLNVTITSPDQDGYVTVFPCGTIPNASNLNFVRTQTIPNSVIAPVSGSGDVCLFTTSNAHLIVDVNGWFPSSPSGLQGLTPSRVLDTRTGVGGVPVGPVATGGILTKTVTGSNGVPATGVSAVSLNVTVTSPQGPGYVTIYPCGTPPNASNLNFVLNQTIPNAVIAPLNALGQLCIFTSAATHVIIDVNGWFPSTGFTALTPSRVFDTRNGIGGVPAVKINAGATLAVTVLNRNGVPATGVSGVALNVTVTSPTNAGYLTVYPCGSLPNASNLNFDLGQTIPNQVLAPLSASGQVCFFASQQTHLIADVSGWFPTGNTSFQGLTPSRLFDSRS